jgi:hypothetical protein
MFRIYGNNISARHTVQMIIRPGWNAGTAGYILDTQIALRDLDQC